MTGANNPVPPELAVDPGGGFVGSDDAGGLELFLDRGPGLVEPGFHPAEGVDDRALRDRQGRVPGRGVGAAVSARSPAGRPG